MRAVEVVMAAAVTVAVAVAVTVEATASLLAPLSAALWLWSGVCKGRLGQAALRGFALYPLPAQAHLDMTPITCKTTYISEPPHLATTYELNPPGVKSLVPQVLSQLTSKLFV